MNGLNFPNEYKSIKYVTVFLWTILGYSITRKYFSPDNDQDVIIQILIIVAWIIWILMIRSIYLELKTVFRKK